MFPDHGNRYTSLRSGRAPGADADQTGGFPPPHPPRFAPSRRPWLGIPAGRARCARMFSPASRRGAFALVPFAAGGCKGLLRRFAPLRPSSLPARRTRPLRRCRWGGGFGVPSRPGGPLPAGLPPLLRRWGGGSRWSLSAFMGVRCGFVFSRFVSRCRRVAWLAGFTAVRALVALARRFGAGCRRVSLARPVVAPVVFQCRGRGRVRVVGAGLRVRGGMVGLGRLPVGRSAVRRPLRHGVRGFGAGGRAACAPACRSRCASRSAWLGAGLGGWGFLWRGGAAAAAGAGRPLAGVPLALAGARLAPRSGGALCVACAGRVALPSCSAVWAAAGSGFCASRAAACRSGCAAVSAHVASFRAACVVGSACAAWSAVASAAAWRSVAVASCSLFCHFFSSAVAFLIRS